MVCVHRTPKLEIRNWGKKVMFVTVTHTSPMAGVERFTIKAGKEMFLLENSGNITLSEKKESGIQFSIMGREGRWYWESHSPDNI